VVALALGLFDATLALFERLKKVSASIKACTVVLKSYQRVSGGCAGAWFIWRDACSFRKVEKSLGLYKSVRLVYLTRRLLFSKGW